MASRDQSLLEVLYENVAAVSAYRELYKFDNLRRVTKTIRNWLSQYDKIQSPEEKIKFFLKPIPDV